MIRTVDAKDSLEISIIYNYYIENTIITFEEEPVSADEMRRRITEVAASYPWLVYETGGSVLGYAYAGKWKERASYRYAVEVSIYLSNNNLGKGIGKQLYAALLAELRKTDVHAIIGGMALPNEPSRRLHESLGFKKIAEFKEVGYKFQKWIDVGYWELLV